MSGPANKIRNPQSTFIKIPFTPSKFNSGTGTQIGTEESPRIFFALEPILPTVVTGKEKSGELFEPECFKQAHQFPNLSIDHGNHDRIILRILWNTWVLDPGFLFVKFPCGITGRYIKHSMRRSKGQVAEKRLLFIFFDKTNRFLKNSIMRIALSGATPVISGQGDFFTVPNQIRRVESMSVNLIVVAKEFIKAMFFRDARGIPPPTTPFSKASGGISPFFE